MRTNFFKDAFYGVLVLLLLSFTIVIFLVGNVIVLSSILGFFIVIILIFRLGIFRYLKMAFIVIPFIAMPIVFSYLDTNNFDNSIFIALRVYNVSSATFVFSKSLSVLQFSRGIAFVLFPLAIFRIHPRHVAVTISIAISFIPILRKEYSQIKIAMNTRGKKRSFKLQIAVMTYKILYRAGQLSQTLSAKAFD